MSPASGAIVRFGTFEVDLRSGELRKRGVRVRLPAQPFQVLAILLERPGQLVTRDDLRDRLWPADTFVDFDRGLNKAVNRLREALGDDAESPRFIETLPKRGYRFIAPLQRDLGAGVTDEGGQRDLTARVPGPAVSSPAGHETPTRHRRPSWLLGGVVVLAAAGAAMAWGWRTPPRLTAEERVVVADFDNRTGEPTLTPVLTQALTLELERSRLARVVTTREVMRTLQLMQRPGTALTADVASDVCRRTGSKALLTGSVDRLGSEFVLVVHASDCRTGHVLAREQERARSKEGVLDALGSATRRLRVALGETLRELPPGDARVHSVLSTASIEAFEAYTTGERMVLQGRSPLPLFEQAVERDPDFAYAHAALGLIYGTLGETARASASTQRAFNLRSRVSDWEQYFIRAQYALQVTGELESLPALCESWIARYPHDRTARNRLAFTYRQLGDLERAAREYERARQIGRSHPVDLQMLATTYMNLGRLDEAAQIVADERAALPEARRLRLLDYLIQFARSGRVSGPAPGEAAGASGDEWAYAQSNTLAAEGRMDDARRVATMAIESASRQGFPGRAALWRANVALRDALMDRGDLARRDARAALAMSEGWDVQVVAALALARAGDVTEAATIAERLATTLPRHTVVRRYWLPTIRAGLALARDEPDGALEALSDVAGFERAGLALTAGPPLHAVYLRGLAYLRAGRSLDAAREFEAIIGQPGIVLNHPVGSLATLQLARAWVAADRTADALETYQTILARWQRADGDARIVVDARRERSRLGRTD